MACRNAAESVIWQRWAKPRPLQNDQSAGGFSISQKSLAGLSNSSPSNHEAPSTSEIESTILACLLRPLAISSTITRVSFSSRSLTMTPHPCALTTTVRYFPEELRAGSRLVITTGICRDRRVLRLASFLCLSGAVPSLGFKACRPPEYILRTAEEMARFRVYIYENRTTPVREARIGPC